MIFDWEKEFSEKTITDGMYLEDNVSYVSEWTNYLSGIVNDAGESYSVSIELDEDFRISSMECECKKKKCKHMTALIHATAYLSNRYIELNYTVDQLDQKKLLKFLKEQISYNDDCRDDFKEKFKQDIIKKELLSYEEELYLIFNDFEWEKDLLNFINKDLKKLYDEGEYRNVFFLITVMFDNVIEKVAFESNPIAKECYNTIVSLIKKLSKHIEDIIFNYLKHLIESHYDDLYPPFKVLMKFYKKNCK